MKLSTTRLPRPSAVDESTAVGRAPQESVSTASSKTLRSLAREQPNNGLMQGALAETGVARNSLIAFSDCASPTLLDMSIANATVSEMRTERTAASFSRRDTNGDTEQRRCLDLCPSYSLVYGGLQKRRLSESWLCSRIRNCFEWTA